jgi:tetratricopeptide (TPR) repeat protein
MQGSRSPTEIPHLAFTHHRIGIHRTPAEKHAAGFTELRPFFDLSQWGEFDRKRSLGLAYLEATESAADATAKAGYQRRAMELLFTVRDAGMRDPVLDSRLAQLCFTTKQGDPLAYAQSALADPELVGLDRCNALSVVANGRFAQGNAAEALSILRDLTRARRQPIDWLLVAECEQVVGNPAAAEDAMETAVRINPRMWVVHKHLAEFYRRQGKTDRAEWHLKRADP